MEILPFSCRFYFSDLFFLPYEFPNQHLSFNLSVFCCCATNTIPIVTFIYLLSVWERMSLSSNVGKLFRFRISQVSMNFFSSLCSPFRLLLFWICFITVVIVVVDYWKLLATFFESNYLFHSSRSLISMAFHNTFQEPTSEEMRYQFHGNWKIADFIFISFDKYDRLYHHNYCYSMWNYITYLDIPWMPMPTSKWKKQKKCWKK